MSATDERLLKSFVETISAEASAGEARVGPHLFYFFWSKYLDIRRRTWAGDLRHEISMGELYVKEDFPVVLSLRADVA